MTSILCLIFWINERLTHQAGPDPFCVIVPCVGKIAQGSPRVFSLTNVSIRPCHGLNGCGHGEWFLLLVLVRPGHDFKHAERHENFPLSSRKSFYFPLKSVSSDF